LRVLDADLDISLLPDEELLVEGKPDRSTLTRVLAVTWTILSLCLIVGIPFIPLWWWMASVYARKHKYWITNNRVIVANGLIGYNVRSIPLERVSDVAVRVSWLEKLFGLKSITIRDMTGEAQAGAVMMAVPDAPATQAHVLDYVRQVNREAAGGNARAMKSGVYRDVERMGSQQQLLAVLSRIEENTRHLPRVRVDPSGDEVALAEAAEVEADEAAVAERALCR